MGPAHSSSLCPRKLLHLPSLCYGALRVPVQDSEAGILSPSCPDRGDHEKSKEMARDDPQVVLSLEADVSVSPRPSLLPTHLPWNPETICTTSSYTMRVAERSGSRPRLREENTADRKCTLGHLVFSGGYTQLYSSGVILDSELRDHSW